jgi:hypothetical protein
MQVRVHKKARTFFNLPRAQSMFASPWLLAWPMLAPLLAQKPAHQASGGLNPRTAKL